MTGRLAVVAWMTGLAATGLPWPAIGLLGAAGVLWHHLDRPELDDGPLDALTRTHHRITQETDHA